LIFKVKKTKNASLMNDKYKKILTPLMASLTLGLAPFIPEPHIWGKLKWVLGGAKGMNSTDWFDFLMHGAPWAWLIFTLAQVIISEKKV
jgi:hypothetical protein